MSQEEMRRRRRDVPSLVEGLINDLTAVLWEADPQTFQFIYVSQGAERLLGFPVLAWLEEADFWARHLHPDDRAEAVTHCLLATRDGGDHAFQSRMVGRRVGPMVHHSSGSARRAGPGHSAWACWDTTDMP